MDYEINDFDEQLLAHDATYRAFRLVARKLGIVFLTNIKTDECIGVWYYQIQTDDEDEYELRQISAKAHNAAEVVQAILNGIQDISSYKKPVKLLHYNYNREIVKRRLREHRENNE